MTISLVIPVYNGERYLAAALRSCLENRLAPTEILVVDDGSTDQTAAVAASFSGVQVIQQAQSGPGAARHRGIQASSGDYLTFLDADDLWTSDKLQLQAAYLKANPEMDGVFGSVQQFRCPDWPDPSPFDARPQAAQLPGTFLLRRTAYERTGPFNESYRVGEFIEWCLRAQDAGCQFGAIAELVLYRRLHQTNLGRSQPASRQDYARIVMEAMRRRRLLAQA